MTKPIEKNIEEPTEHFVFTLESIPEEIIVESDSSDDDDTSDYPGDLIFGFPPSPTESSPIDYSPHVISPFVSVPQSPVDSVVSGLFARRVRVFITETPSDPEERIVAGTGGPYTYARFGDDADDVDEIWWDDKAIERFIDVMGIPMLSERSRIQYEWDHLMESVGISCEHQPPIPRWFIASCLRAYGPELDFDHTCFENDYDEREFHEDRLTNDKYDEDDDLTGVEYDLGYDVVLDVNN